MGCFLFFGVLNREVINLEKWDLYTRDGLLTNKKMIRGDEIPDGLYHRVVHIWIRNNNGKYLINQRSEECSQNKYMWECVGGSVISGEQSIDAAVREVKEEVGLEIEPATLRLAKTIIRDKVKGKRYNDILDVFVCEYNSDDSPIDLTHATTNEVCDTRWLDFEQIALIFDKGFMVSSLGYFSGLLGPKLLDDDYGKIEAVEW